MSTWRTHLPREGGRAARGFTIVEIVMAFIIIGILVTVLVPILTSRSAEAKLSAAQQDLQSLADAMDRASIDSGYFYRIYALNDVRGGDGIPNALSLTAPTNTRDHVQGILDNQITGNNLYTAPSVIFILSTTQDFAPNQATIFARLQANETSFGWNGPYLTWFHDANHNDWPDDPWGNDYLFFTTRGMIYPPDPNAADPILRVTDHSYTFQPTGPTVTVNSTTGGPTVQKAFPAVGIFDRPTFLSLGPNGLPGDGTDAVTNAYGQGDDVVRPFGGAAQ